MIQLFKKYFIIICFVLLTLINFSFSFFREKESNQVMFSNSQSNEPLKASLEEPLEESLEKPLQEPLEEPLQKLSTEVAVASPTSESLNSQKVERLQVEIPIYICGEVLNPGVYYVHPDALVNDIIQLAGGVNAQADATQLNLASVVVPNSKIYVPKIGEEIDKMNDSYENRVDSISDLNRQQDKVASSTHLININTADISTLEQLPGIGSVKAQAIIDYRNQVGGFNQVDDLINVSGIGQKTFDKLKNLVCT